MLTLVGHMADATIVVLERMLLGEKHLMVAENATSVCVLDAMSAIIRRMVSFMTKFLLYHYIFLPFPCKQRLLLLIWSITCSPYLVIYAVTNCFTFPMQGIFTVPILHFLRTELRNVILAVMLPYNDEVIYCNHFIICYFIYYFVHFLLILYNFCHIPVRYWIKHFM